MLRTAARRSRPGFTLVELMVSAAVCVLIMAVLATAFSLGIDTMRQMRSTGEMMDQLRGAETALKADLKAPHLLNKDGLPVPLSSFRWDKLMVKDDGVGATPRFTLPGWEAPFAGFFRVGSGPLTPEGADADGLGSGRATNHYLHFTSILSGLSDDDYYVAQVDNLPPIGPKTYRSQAAEIAYFLDPTPTGVTPDGKTNLFRLVRRQRLVALHDTDRRDRPWPTFADHAVISLRPSGVPNPPGPPFFLAILEELRSPSNRLGGVVSGTAVYAPNGTGGNLNLSPMVSDPFTTSTTRDGEDTLLSNVISFEVQLIYKFPSDPRLPVVAGYPRPFNNAGSGPLSPTTSEAPFDVLPPSRPPTGFNTTGVATSTYDSWDPVQAAWTSSANINQTTGVVNASPTVPPLLIRVQAVQIRIRIWDPKLQNARQVTVVQDL